MPSELARARLIDALLRRYPGYTLTTLRSESAELLEIVELVEMAKPSDG